MTTMVITAIEETMAPSAFSGDFYKRFTIENRDCRHLTGDSDIHCRSTMAIRSSIVAIDDRSIVDNSNPLAIFFPLSPLSTMAKFAKPPDTFVVMCSSLNL